jgi:hypothetical protein
VRGWIALAALAAPLAWAQLELYRITGNTEERLGSFHDMGAAAPGERLTLDLRVRNASQTPAQVTRFFADGAGFSIERPLLPFTIPAGGAIAARLVFRADLPAAYSANLQVNGVSVLVAATVLPAPRLTVFPACTISPPDTVSFGSTEPSELRVCSFTLQNDSSQTLLITVFDVTGEGFSGPFGHAPPVTLAAGQTVSFSVRFTPPRAGLFTGTLRVASRSYRLEGSGVNPPLPKPAIDLESTPLASAQQRRLTLRLPEPARFDAGGQIQFSFTPDSPLVSDDPGIVFVATGTRSLPFTVRQGSAEVRIGGQPFAVLQTGTSSGRLRFTLSAPGGFAADPTAVFNIPPAAIAIDSTSGVRGIDRLDVRVTGFDNTYTTGAMAFTFYDVSGRRIGGTIRADFTDAFRAFYASAPAGSAFQFAVTFPVSGNPAAIGSVDLELSNAAGSVRVDRLPFR